MSTQPPVSVQTLFLDHRKTLVRTLLRMVGCRQTAEDLAQEAYTRLLGANENKQIHHPAPFLFQIARNLAVDHIRREQIRARSDADIEDSAAMADVPANTAQPDRAVGAMQQTTLMLDVLRAMPQRRQQIFIMHRIHGCTYEQIAARFGISRSGVEKQLQKAMLQLLDAGVDDV